MRYFCALFLLAGGLLVSADIESEVGPLLSPNARLVFPTSAEWTNLTARWDPYAIPDLNVDVEAITASDVQATVKYAATNGIKLLVRNTSHGFTRTVGSVVDGIQLTVRKMNSISLDLENNVATLGGGVIVAEVIDALYKANKRSATGNCDCVGLMGAGLGGGHGRHQGLHGLVSDNIISAKMVIANGTLITVSATENADLYWAIRGAGHNFGVVVEFQLRIYDKQEADNWTSAVYLYEDHQLEEVFTFLNEYREVQPKEMTLFAGFTRTAVAADAPGQVRLSIQYGGHDDYTTVGAPFLSLSPLSATNSSIPYPQVATATGIGLNMGFCVGRVTRRAHFSTQLKTFIPAAIRNAKTFYDDTMIGHPWLNASSIVWEMYPLQAFKAVPAASTAYPHRDMNMLSLFMANYKNASYDALAEEIGNRAREVLLQSAGEEGHRVYVNYALGDEENGVIYEGPEGWRLQKLRRLKKKFDPMGVFNAYNPIEIGSR